MAGAATRETFGETIVELADHFPHMVVLDADLSKSTMTQAFAKKFPARHLELGIAEQNMVGVGAGLALCGKIPVMTSFACFLTGRLEPIRVAVGYNSTNVKLVGTHAGLGIGEDGASQMGLEDVSAMRALPGMVILQPADAAETRQAVRWMLDHEGPVYLRLTRQKLDDCHGADYQFRLGRADEVFGPPGGVARLLDGRSRLQATIFASGGTVPEAIRAGRELENRGFRARVMNAGTLHPFDGEAVVQAAKTSQRIVTVEDHNVVGGLGSAVSECAAKDALGVPVVTLGARAFGESGLPAELYEKFGISSAHIVDACLRNLDLPEN